jgi:hypothetical protein
MKPLPPRPARGVAPARWVALLATLLLAQAVLARRFDVIDTPTLFATLAAALVFALVAAGFVFVALRDVWRDGAPGAGRAIVAAVLVVLTLTPFAAAGVAAAYYPALSDVSTDTADPPRFLNRAAPVIPTVRLVPPEFVAAHLQNEAFPEIVTRRLALSTVEAHAAARLAVMELGWLIRADIEPAGENEFGMIEAEARALFLGVPDDVVIRVRPSEAGSRLDVRSASRIVVPDLGENARRIKAFFERLDDVTTRPAIP